MIAEWSRPSLKEARDLGFRFPSHRSLNQYLLLTSDHSVTPLPALSIPFSDAPFEDCKAVFKLNSAWAKLIGVEGHTGQVDAARSSKRDKNISASMKMPEI